jgi:hypothetical protein
VIARLGLFGLLGGLSMAWLPAGHAAEPVGAALNACALISPEEVSAVLGAKVGDADRQDSGTTPDGAWSSTCIWKLRGGPKTSSEADAPFGGAGFAMLNTITWPGGSDAARKYLEDFRDAAKNDLIDMTPVPVQAGDEALWWGDGVAVRKGAVSFGVSVHTGTDKPSERKLEETLAQKIAGRL